MAVDLVPIWIFFVYFSFAIDFDPRLDALARIKKYELLHIDTSEFSSSNIIQFTAFDQFYCVQLEVKEHFNPSRLKHTHGNPSQTNDSLIQFYTHKTESCHYRGTVINSNASSSVSMSICDKRGIRGQVAAFGELLIIKPSRYYLDIEHDSTKFHHHSDEHLVYKQSDYNVSGLYTTDSGGVRSSDSRSGQDTTSPLVNKVNNRRRLSGEKNYVELAAMIGPEVVRNFQSRYPDKWYDELVAEHSDVISDADRLYDSTNWGSDVGTINIKFKEIEIVWVYEGIYEDLEPNLMTEGKYKGKRMNDYDLLNRVTEYGRDRKDINDFDVLEFFHERYSGIGAAGLAPMNVMCKNTGSRWSWATTGLTACHLSASCSGTLAHEIGHNFNLNHDGQPGSGSSCNKRDGLMGPRSGNNNVKFSSCSINTMQKYFKDTDMSCLSNSYSGSVKSNIDYYTDGEAESLEESDLGSGCNEAIETAKCVQISGAAQDYGMNGVWTVMEGKCHQGHNVYKMEHPTQPTYYMYREPNRGVNADAWFWSTEIGGDKYAFCENYGWRSQHQTGKDITLCTNRIFLGKHHSLWRKFKMDDSVTVKRSCNAPLVLNDCFDKETVVNDEICVYNNKTLWDLDDEEERYRSFKISDECSNGQTFYTHDAKSEMFNGTLKYYLHLQGDGNLTDYRWIFVQDFMLNDPVTYCESDDLGECLNGNWMYTSYQSDSIRDVVDDNMVIYNMPCHQVLMAQSEDKSMSMASVLAIGLIALVFLLLIGFGIFCFVKRSKERVVKQIEIIEKELGDQDNIEVEVETEEMITNYTK